MRLEIESTTEIVYLNDVPARIWEGKTKSGIPVTVFIVHITTSDDHDKGEFESELQQHRSPSPETQQIPFRLIL
jgi:hypothetical protein